MATTELGNNQIQPAAQPLSTFITPNMVNPARPATPSEVQAPGQFSLVATGSRGNVEGANNGLRLAQALEGFNKNLTEVAFKGLGMYASGEYQRGQSEAFKASMLAQRQMEQGGKDYAADNRALGLKDPIAAMAMDTVNPFRSAGRRNAFSQVAGQQVGSAMELAYNARRGELAKLEPGDPKINEIKAQAADSILQRYDLTEDEPGFIDYVLPNLNRSWERITAQQQSDRAEWQKQTIITTLPLTVQGQIVEAIRQGATPGQAAVLVTKTIDAEMLKLGLPGEGIEMAKKVAEALWRAALTKDEKGNINTELFEVVQQIEIGDPTPNGFRPTIASLFGAEIEDRQALLESRQWEQEQRGREVAGRAFESDAAAQLAGMEDGPEKQAAMEGLLNSDDPRYAGLDRAERLALVGSANQKAEAFDGLGYSPDDNEAWLLNQEEKYGNAWKPEEAMDEFRDRLKAIPDGPEREDFRRRFLALREKKNREQGDMPNALINKSVNDRIAANLQREYPNLGPEIQRAQASGVDMGAYLANKSADAATSAQRQRSAYTRHIYAALGAAAAKKGGPLTSLEEQEAIDRALDGYGKSNPKAAAASLFPGGVTSGAPTSVPGGKNPTPGAPAAGGSPKTGGKPSAPVKPTFPISRVQDAPVDRLRNWKGDPIVDPQSLVDMVGDVLNGEDYPRQIKAAARKAGTTPGRFVVDQIKLHPELMRLQPSQEKQLLKQGQAQASAQRYADGVAPTVSRRAGAGEESILARAGRYALNAITGATPVSAASRGGQWRFRDGGGGGGGGGSWDSGPAVALSDPATGSGYGIAGQRDYNGRLVVFSRPAANAWAAMVRDSKGEVSASDIHSSQRSPAHNRNVGGVEGSKHLGGNAMDIHGRSNAWIRKHGAKYGWYIHEYGGSGDHKGHFEFRGGGTAAPGRSTSRRSRVSAAPAPRGPAGFKQLMQTAQVAGVKFPQLLSAMWALESGYGSKPSGRNNYWNQKDEKGNWKNFGHWSEGFDFLVSRWFKPWGGYKGLNAARNINEAMQMLLNENYVVGDPNYIPKLRKIMRENGAPI